MRSSGLLAGALAAAVALGASVASAADLDPYGKSSGHPAYDDPRYADIFGPGPKAPPYAPQGYDQRHYGGPNHAPPQPYGHPPYPPSAHPHADAAPGCVPRVVIRQQLRSEGWHDFHAIVLRPRFAVVNARRPNGDLYRLRIDRCSGQIAGARPIAPGAAPPPYGIPPYAAPRPYYGPFAYGPRPYPRPY